MENQASDVAALRRQVCSVILERGYSRAEQPFRLSSGGTSRDYVDLRRAVARGAELRLFAEAVLADLDERQIAFEAIGGMTMGADPVAHAIALVSGRSWFSVRKAEKTHGSRRRVEGAEIGPGVRVVVFEDTVSTGGSLLDAYEVVEATGAEVVACFTVLDRGEEARRRFAERSVRYEAMLTYADLGIEPLASPGDGPAQRAGTPF
jgi:orotate phosphoribosyltransferase